MDRIIALTIAKGQLVLRHASGGGDNNSYGSGARQYITPEGGVLIMHCSAWGPYLTVWANVFFGHLAFRFAQTLTPMLRLILRGIILHWPALCF